MSAVATYFKSSIGKKTIMGITGLIWSGFVAGHMAGNMLILVSADAYNKYGHALITNPLLPLVEAFLVLTLVVHFAMGMKLTMENKMARPDGYLSPPSSAAKTPSAASRTMIFTGSLMLIFIVWHLVTFKFGPVYTTTVGGVEMRDLARLMFEVFQNPLYVVWYVGCLIALGFHLSHGFQSSFQSLGFYHPRYTKWIKSAGFVYSLVVALGFISQPLYVFFFR
jgi:succinate dehydrogenase / fumarate reductase cytochrome b subunit